MHILIAPNAFKNSLDAAKVAEAINNGLHKSKLSCTTTCFPVADGGDGTAGLLIDHLGWSIDPCDRARSFKKKNILIIWVDRKR